MSIATLGKDMKAEGYYPNDDPNLEIGEDFEWHLMLFNRMGRAQLVSARIKLLNSTQSPPDSQTHNPSAGELLLEINRLLLNNETWTTPLVWDIAKAIPEGEGIRIRAISFNGETREVDVASRGGNNFRIVIELWSFDLDSGEFEYPWKSGDELRSAWNQIWFNVTLTS